MKTLRLGSKGSEVRRLQKALGIEADGIFGPKTEEAVEKFQRRNKLYADGIAGKMTLSALGLWNEADTPSVPVLAPDNPSMLTWVKCPADKLDGRDGYMSTTLRSDVAGAYKDLYTATHDLGGVVTSAGGRRGLVSKAGPNRSRTSMHYVGRAFDMALPTGMKDPATDPFVIVKLAEGNNRHWTVWCRSSLSEEELKAKCAEAGIHGGLVDLDGTYVKNRKVCTQTVSCVAFNFTGLAGKFGFAGISARLAFFSKGDVTAAEWWHFQWTTGLVKGKTRFGDELLKIYSLEEAQKFVYWASARGAVFGDGWN